VDEESVNEVAEVVAVSEDGSQTANATDAVTDDWMPVPTDSNGRPFAVVVRPVEHCSRWKFSRVFFEINGGDRFRIRVGDTDVVDWVSWDVVDKISSAQGRFNQWAQRACARGPRFFFFLRGPGPQMVVGQISETN